MRRRRRPIVAARTTSTPVRNVVAVVILRLFVLFVPLLCVRSLMHFPHSPRDDDDDDCRSESRTAVAAACRRRRQRPFGYADVSILDLLLSFVVLNRLFVCVSASDHIEQQCGADIIIIVIIIDDDDGNCHVSAADDDVIGHAAADVADDRHHRPASSLGCIATTVYVVLLRECVCLSKIN